MKKKKKPQLCDFFFLNSGTLVKLRSTCWCWYCYYKLYIRTSYIDLVEH